MYGKTGEQSPFYGRHHTEAVKRQKSIQSKEFANRPETKEMLRKVLRRTRHNQVKPNKHPSHQCTANPSNDQNLVGSHTSDSKLPKTRTRTNSGNGCQHGPTLPKQSQKHPRIYET